MLRPTVALLGAVAIVSQVYAAESQSNAPRPRLHAGSGLHAASPPAWMKYAWLDITDIRGKEVTSVSVNGQALYPRVDNHYRYALHLADESAIANVHVTFKREKPWSSEFVARAGQTYALHFHAAGAALLVADVSQATIEAEIQAAESRRRALSSERRSELARRNVLEKQIRDAKSERDRIQKLIRPRSVAIQGLDSDYQTKQRDAVQAESQADAACRLKDAAQQELDEQTALLKLVSDLEKKSQGQQKLSAKLLLAEVTQSQLDANQAFIAAQTNCNNASNTAQLRRNEADAAKHNLLAEKQAKSQEESDFEKNDEIAKVSSGKLAEIQDRIDELTRKIAEKNIEIHTLRGLLPPEAPPATTPETTPEVPPAEPSSAPTPPPPPSETAPGSPPPPPMPPSEKPPAGSLPPAPPTET